MVVGVATAASRTSRTSHVTASARLLHLVFDPATPDAALAMLLSDAGLVPADVADPDARIPHEAIERLLARGIELARDPDLGLHLAELVKPGAFDVLECIARTSPTLGDALRGLGRYHRVLHDAWSMDLTVRDGFAIVQFGLPPPLRLSRAAAEFCMATLLLGARRIFGAELGVSEICFAHDAPEDMREHVRIFRTPVHFSAGRNAVRFAAEWLVTPLPGADHDVCAVLERHAKAMLERLPAARSYADQVQARILAELPRGAPTLAGAAKALGASPRTVRRRLAAEATSYQALLDALRKELALRYLDESLSVEEVAYALGFSEPSAFRRAFRRWTGRTVAEHRRGTIA